MNKQLIYALIALMLAGCGGQATDTTTADFVPPPTWTVVKFVYSNYFPLNADQRKAYSAELITGKYDPNTMAVTVATATPAPAQSTLYLDSSCGAVRFQNSYTQDAAPKPVDRMPAWFEQSPDAWRVEMDAHYPGNGKAYIGTGMFGDFHVYAPGVPKITALPVAGEIIDGTSTVEAQCLGANIAGLPDTMLPSVTWRYKTVSIDAEYKTVKTARSVSNGMVETFTFENNVGAVEIVMGTIDSNYGFTGRRLTLIR